MSDKSGGEFKLYDVSTRFQAMARRAGGTLRHAAISAAFSELQSNSGQFLGMLSDKSRELARLVETQSEFDVLMNTLYELRDVGTTVGYPSITIIADILRQVIESAGSKARHATLRCFARSITLCVERDYRDCQGPEARELIAGLQSLAKNELERLSQ